MWLVMCHARRCDDLRTWFVFLVVQDGSSFEGKLSPKYSNHLTVSDSPDWLDITVLLRL